MYHLEISIRLNDSLSILMSNNDVGELTMKHEYREKSLADSLKMSGERKLVAVQLEKEKNTRYAIIFTVSRG